MVVDRVQLGADAGQGVSDGGAIPDPLSLILIIENPRRDAGTDDEPRSRLEKQMAAADPSRASRTPIAKDRDRKALG